MKKRKAQHQLLLTFDVEDFINNRSVGAFHAVLELLRKHGLKGLFFITGHMAEKLTSFPKILSLLDSHEIGFHSSAHSVHPTIFEYCDVESYEEAYLMTLERETAHINPLSGAIEGSGGINVLRKLFPSKEVLAYRAPGYCCPPPHLEAMAHLGIKHDFSMNLSAVCVSYKGITFYPLPIFLDGAETLCGETEMLNWAMLLNSIMRKKTTILNFHIDRFINETWWDSIYHERNPSELRTVLSKETQQTASMIYRMDALLKATKVFEGLGIVNTLPCLSKAENELDLSNIDIRRILDMYTFWPRIFFGYKSKHVQSHFSRFFDCQIGARI